MDWLCRNWGHNPLYPIVEHIYQPCPCLIPLPLKEEVTVRITGPVSPVWTEPSHEHAQDSVPWPHNSSERVGRNATGTSTSTTSIIHFMPELAAAWPSETLVSFYVTIGSHNPEDRDFNHKFGQMCASECPGSTVTCLTCLSECPRYFGHT